jgi:pentatricopeptide repeat protein
MPTGNFTLTIINFFLALLHFQKMKEQGIKPDINSYKWIMGGLWKEPEEVMKYFQELKKARLSPDVHVYNRVLYAVKTEPKEMVKYYREMKKKKIVPTERTLSLLQTTKDSDVPKDPLIAKQLDGIIAEVSKIVEAIKKEEEAKKQNEEEEDDEPGNEQ